MSTNRGKGIFLSIWAAVTRIRRSRASYRHPLAPRSLMLSSTTAKLCQSVARSLSIKASQKSSLPVRHRFANARAIDTNDNQATALALNALYRLSSNDLGGLQV